MRNKAASLFSCLQPKVQQCNVLDLGLFLHRERIELWSNISRERNNNNNNKAVVSTTPGTLRYSHRDATSDQKNFEKR